jgi:hypothetical protein
LGEDLHHDKLPDPTVDMIRHLTARVVSLEASMGRMNANEYMAPEDEWVESGGSHI